jgi:hypothetical protein
VGASRGESRRAFLSARYLPDAIGRLTPGKPLRCPRTGDDDLVCNVVVKEWCQRGCGPGYALLACVCYAHGGFRIYPLGWRRYSRAGLLDDNASPLAAVRDGAAGTSWPELARSGSATRRTQRRWTAIFCKLAGVESALGDDERIRAAWTLGLTTLMLQDGANRIRAGPTSKADSVWLISMML